MKTSGNKLSLRDKENYLQLLQEQLQQELMSTEEIRRLGIDRDGITYDLGGNSQGVLIDESGVPRTISEERTMFLDCGHAITSPSQVLGRCDNGHVLCNMYGHQLVECVKCGKLLCDLCASTDNEGRPQCSNHGFPWNILYKLCGL